MRGFAVAGKKQVAMVKAGTSKESAEKRRADFVEAFLTNGGNAKQAAITAGFSPRTAEYTGSTLLREPKVSALIDHRRRELLAASRLTTEELAKDLARTIRFDPRKLYRDDGTLRPIHELDDDTALCLTGMEVTTTVEGETRVTTKKLKWENKTTARDQAMRMLGMFELDNRQKGSPLDGLPRELVQAMVQRLRALNGQA
jgi:phage terminase small subunit